MTIRFFFAKLDKENFQNHGGFMNDHPSCNPILFRGGLSKPINQENPLVIKKTAVFLSMTSFKNFINFAVINIATSLYAAETIPTFSESSFKKEHSSIEISPRRFIPYVRLGPDIINMQVSTSLGEIKNNNNISPCVGLGFRSESASDAVDLSFSVAVHKTEKPVFESYGDSSYELSDTLYTLQFFYPKLLYLRYTNPDNPSSPYFGGGLGWSQFFNQETDSSFNGLAGVVAFGYEMGRSSIIRQMAQLEITQPLVPSFSKGATLTPSLQLSYCLGF